MSENWISEKTVNTGGFNGSGRIIEGVDGAGTEETGYGGDEGGGRFSFSGVVRESWNEMGDMTEEEAINGRRGGGEALDDGG